jgi:TPR repeat protein
MAAQYFQQAADVGDATAMRFLAAMVERGLLGPPDAARAAALRARAQAVDPNGATPNMPPSPPAANSATVAADRWHGVATSLPRCWPACSAK